jgi:tripartite ATP-independent transporter DctM subunit
MTEPAVAGLLGLLGLFTLIGVGLPIGFSFMAVGFLGVAHLAGLHSAVAALARIPFTWINEYVFTCVPLFVLSGFLIAKTGVATELFSVGDKWLGRLPGGLAMATTVAVGLFSAVSGSSTACVATMSATCYPEMKRHRYQDSLATGSIAAGGGIDLMIPPSLGFVIFGIMSEESIGKLFIAGIIPGILQVLSFFLVIYLAVRLKPSLAPLRETKFIPWREKIASLGNLWVIVALFGLVIGGIYFGIFTPIEAGAISSAGALAVTGLTGRLTLRSLSESLAETASVTVIIFVLLIGAMVFNVFLTLSNLPQAIAGLLNSTGSPIVGLALILLLYIPLGMVMDATGMIVLTVPLYLPFLTSNGISLVWFGVLLMMMVEIGLITPPVGMNVFVVQGVIKKVPMEVIFRGMVPFLIADLVVLTLLVAFPQLSLFLPNLMR